MSGSDMQSAAELASHIERCALPATGFGHREHAQLAWFYLRRYPLLTAVVRYQHTLRRFATSLGMPDKYDEQLTVAYMLLLEERRRESASDDWARFAADNRDILDHGRAVVERRVAEATAGPCDELVALDAHASLTVRRSRA